MLHIMTRIRLLLLLILLSGICCLALFLPGWFTSPRELIQGEWQEIHKMGSVTVTDSTARWVGSNHRANITYTWIQENDEPYTIEITYRGEKWLANITFESDDQALVNFLIIDKLPQDAQDFIRQRNKAKNRPEDEVCMRFRRLSPQKQP